MSCEGREVMALWNSGRWHYSKNDPTDQEGELQSRTLYMGPFLSR